MNSFFIDTNIFIDVFIPSNTFHNEASDLIEQLLEGEFDCFISSHSLTDIFYISRRYADLEARKRFLLFLVSNFQIVPESHDNFLDVLRDKNFFDLEDGLQMNLANQVNADYIITENLKDFLNSKIPAIDIASALKLLAVSS